MDLPLIVRQCTDQDLLALTEEEPAGAGVARRMLQRQRDGRVFFAAAWQGPVPLGTVVLDLHATYSPEMKNLFVNPTRRGEGVGTALCDWLEAKARTVGFDHIYLGVGKDNDRARGLYIRLGYRSIGESTSCTYNYVDEDGSTKTATELSDYYKKPLC
ncbi:GNAT family N-acetyltransferase [Arthrobacter parietis]|uniref:GNAT family N-acetyltransferase n=1 Tax=Arthrobacter parietis TaxID=271434 RepID=UPI0031F9C28C